ncbi:hypothetical protein GQ53DRAFT_509406 [Thozetella sp. PMI_491]|nr:hypothetical protein GQ53DRAFT_509406 [Thozetella sp. PMI_491]
MAVVSPHRSPLRRLDWGDKSLNRLASCSRQHALLLSPPVSDHHKLIRRNCRCTTLPMCIPLGRLRPWSRVTLTSFQSFVVQPKRKSCSLLLSTHSDTIMDALVRSRNSYNISEWHLS